MSLETGLALPSEGKGQRFESSWVRQFSAILSNAELSPVLSNVRATFGCSHGVAESFPKCRKMHSPVVVGQIEEGY